MVNLVGNVDKKNPMFVILPTIKSCFEKGGTQFFEGGINLVIAIILSMMKASNVC